MQAKIWISVLLLSLLSCGTAQTHGHGNGQHTILHEVDSPFPTMDLDGDTLVMTNFDGNHTVKINGLYELFIDGKKVFVPKEAKSLVEKFYVAALKLHKDSLVIGIQGAKAGRLGQLIAKDALEQVARAFDESSNEEENDEAESEKLSELLKASTDGIEERASELRNKFVAMGGMAKTLKKMIPKLNTIKWFKE